MNNVYIAPNATVVGDVELHENVNIWYGAVLRGDCGKIDPVRNHPFLHQRIAERIRQRIGKHAWKSIKRTARKFEFIS